MDNEKATIDLTECELYLVINALTWLHTTVDKLGTAAHRIKAAKIKAFTAKLDTRYTALYLANNDDMEFKTSYTVKLEAKK